MARTLRSKRLRSLLWLAAGGKCQGCGKPLPDNWHADHVKPWSKGGGTSFYNSEALCPTCNLKKGAKTVQPWRQFLRINPEVFGARLAQEQAFNWAAATEEIGPGLDVRKRVELVTGYGKTMLAFGVFGILRSRGLIDRMLVIVPGDEQRTQFCDDEQDAKALLGIDCPTRAVEKTGADFAYNRRGERLVFVCTYAQLNDGTLKDLMEDNHRWMVVYDECHHLAEDNIWGNRAESLPALLRLYMTATMLRSDRKGLRGVPMDDASLIAKVDYRTAHGEEAVKQVVGCSEHYQVVCESVDGKTFPVTTADLQKEKVKDFKTYEAKRQLRYNMDYLWELLLNPINMLAQKRSADGPSDKSLHQMLIFAMSCRHASFICEAVRSVCSSVGFDLGCDWVGVGEGQNGATKSDRENTDTINRFRGGELDILVSVDKIGEGFSVKTASVLLFLNLLQADAKLLQQVGRGLRRHPKIPFKDDYVHIFFGSDSAIGPLVAAMDQVCRELREKKEGPGPGPGLFDIADLTVVRANHTHREVICPVSPEDIESYLSDYDLSFCRKHGLDPLEYYRHQLGRSGQSPKVVVDDVRSSRQREEAVKSQTNTATSTLVGNIMRLLRQKNSTIGPDTAGKVKRAVNTEWLKRGGGNHDAMTDGEWQRKHSWIKTENDRLRTSKELPSWLGL